MSQAVSVSSSYHLRRIFPVNVLQCISEYLDDPTRDLLIREGELPSSHKITKIMDTSLSILYKLPQGSPDYSAPHEEIDGQYLHFRTPYQQKKTPTCWLEVYQHMLRGAHPTKPIPQEKSMDILRYELTNCMGRTPAALKLQMAAYNKFVKEIPSEVFDLIPLRVFEAYKVSVTDEGIKHPSDKRLSFIGNTLAASAVRKLYQFPASSWDPSKNVSHLLEEVRIHGVISFHGKHGRGYYSEKPHQVLEINGHKIFGWGPQARKSKSELPNADHVIAVVGVIQEHRKEKIEQGRTGYVIYVDPNDKSDPKDPEQQKFYMVSYETFKEHLVNNFGINFPNVRAIMMESIAPSSRPTTGQIEQAMSFIQYFSFLAYGQIPNPPYLKTEKNEVTQEFSLIPASHQDRVYSHLWALKGSPSIPHFGRNAFHGINGLSSATTVEKMEAIKRCQDEFAQEKVMMDRGFAEIATEDHNGVYFHLWALKGKPSSIPDFGGDAFHGTKRSKEQQAQKNSKRSKLMKKN